MQRKSAHKHNYFRYLKFGFIFLIPLIIFLVIFNLLALLGQPKQRVTVAILANPIEVVSYEPAAANWTIIRFPVEVHLSGIYGLGDYAAESLWGVAKTQGKAESVLLGSLTDELGVPVDFYISAKNAEFSSVADGQKAIDKYLTYPAAAALFNGKISTNIPVNLYLALIKSWNSAAFENIQDISLNRDKGLFSKALADGSTVFEINRSQLDAITDDLFEDLAVRQERLRISVFNTTGRPFLGSRVGRILSKRGMNVIEVGNSEEEVAKCLLIGSSNSLTTATAKIIAALFDCDTKVDEEPNKADLRVKIGLNYAKLFVPPEDIKEK